MTSENSRLSRVFLVLCLAQSLFLVACTEPTVSYKLQDTQIKISDGPGNLAWSRKGDMLAYTSGFALWIVPANRWNEALKIYETSIDNEHWDLDSYFLAWSPDDTFIGTTLSRQRNPNMSTMQSGFESRMAQVNWQRRTLSFIAPDDDASLEDWSVTNNIVAYRREFGHFVVDGSSSTIQPLSKSPTCKTEPGFLHWSFDGSLWTACGTESEPGKGVVFYRVSWKTGIWEPLPLRIDSVYSHTAIPMPSPDGRWIAWIEGRLENRSWSIKLYDLKQSKTIEIANSNEYGTSAWQALTWSPNSKQLAFSAVRNEGGVPVRTIWIVKAVQAN